MEPVLVNPLLFHCEGVFQARQDLVRPRAEASGTAFPAPPHRTACHPPGLRRAAGCGCHVSTGRTCTFTPFPLSPTHMFVFWDAVQLQHGHTTGTHTHTPPVYLNHAQPELNSKEP